MKRKRPTIPTVIVRIRKADKRRLVTRYPGVSMSKGLSRLLDTIELWSTVKPDEPKGATR